MDDLISRQAAIEAIQNAKNGGSALRKVMFVKELEALPSAQPERLTDDDFETIRIHLNACKEKLCNQQRWKEADEYQRIIDRFMAFASAQPEPQWIPCSERLPEKPIGVCYFNHDGEDVPGKEYIVMIEDAIEPTSLYWTGDVWFSPYGIDEDTEYDVIAWMPLPEPYKEVK